MPRRSQARSIAFALATLIGFVGGLGTGLHALVHVFGGDVRCLWHAAAHCSNSATSFAFGATAEELNEQQAEFNAGSAADRTACPICTLLSRYHAPSAARAAIITTALLHADVFLVEPRLPQPAHYCAHRPRGPPLSA